MKKRFLSIALTLCMVLALLPTAVIVQAATPTGTALTQDNISGHMDGTTLKNGTYYLNGDITTGSSIKICSEVILDLNGHVLELTGGSGSVICVGNALLSGTLTIKDSNPTGTHSDSGLPAGGVITGGNAVSGDAMSGGGINIENGSVTMNGGTIYGCTAKYGGGIYVGKGSVTMNSGSTISGCTAADSGSYSGKGGGIYVYNGSVTMNSGSTISGCTAKNGGSGVCLNNSYGANFNLAGGTISGTICKYGGGGGNSTFTASGGSVTYDSGDSTFDKLIVPAGSTLNFNGKIANCSSLDSYIGGGTFEKDFCYFSTYDGYKGIISGGTFKGNVAVASDGRITGGTFKGSVNNKGSIKDGDFNADVTNRKGGEITGGTFVGDVTNIGTIQGGTFENVKLDGNSYMGIGAITGGVFNGEVSMNDSSGVTYNITRGTFYGKVNGSNVNITGGTFYGGVDTGKISSDATWYEVKFDTNGGSPVPVTQVFVNPDSNAKAIAPTNPAKDGYEFLGWYEKDTDGALKDTVFDFSTVITGNITFYAKWHEVIKGIKTGGTYCNNVTFQVVDSTYTDVVGYYTAGSSDVIELTSDSEGNYTISSGEDGLTGITVIVKTETGKEVKVSNVTVNAGHTPGKDSADCTHKAKCEVCGEEYGDVDANNHDFTAQVKNSDTLNSAGTCQDKAVYYYSCSRCGEIEKSDTHTFEGEIDRSNHADEKEWSTKNATQHEQTWKCCGAVEVALENHEWKDGVCEECGYVCLHTGGTADCTHKAVCTVCGEEYGEVDSGNHNLENIKSNAATVTDTGNPEYWHCKDCDGNFSDEDGKNEIDLKDTVTPKLPPEIIDGKGQTLTEGEKKELTFRSNAAFGDFIRVEVDGKTVDPENYTVKEGSTVVTLNPGYVATLSVGEHTLGIVFQSGTATTTFTVYARALDATSPQTGDNSHMALMITLLFVSGGALVGTAAFGKKRKYSAK